MNEGFEPIQPPIHQGESERSGYRWLLPSVSDGDQPAPLHDSPDRIGSVVMGKLTVDTPGLIVAPKLTALDYSSSWWLRAQSEFAARLGPNLKDHASRPNDTSASSISFFEQTLDRCGFGDARNLARPRRVVFEPPGLEHRVQTLGFQREPRETLLPSKERTDQTKVTLHGIRGDTSIRPGKQNLTDNEPVVRANVPHNIGA